MKKSVSLLVIAGLIAGCSSPPQTQTDENGEVSNETAAETENSAYACAHSIITAMTSLFPLPKRSGMSSLRIR